MTLLPNTSWKCFPSVESWILAWGDSLAWGIRHCSSNKPVVNFPNLGVLLGLQLLLQKATSLQEVLGHTCQLRVDVLGNLAHISWLLTPIFS